MDNLKKVNKILLVTLLVFSVGVFANYSRTSSKYFIQYSHDKIVNSVGFKSLSEMFSPSSSIVGDKVEYTVKFHRTVATNDSSVESDVLEFVIDKDTTKDGVTNDCEITRIDKYKGKGTPVYNDDKSSVKLTYTKEQADKNISENDQITLVYTCSADKMMIDQSKEKDKLRTSYKVYETIDSEPMILYFGGTFETDKDYQKPAGYEISEDKTKLKFTRDDVELNRQILNDWINQYTKEYYSSQNGSNMAVDNLTAYAVLDTLLSPNTANSIKGITYDKDKREYTFDKNVMSLAYTDFYKHNPKRLYFIPADKDFSSTVKKEFTKAEIEELYTYYYDKYYKPTYTADENEYVTKYITDNGGIGEILVNDKIVAGISVRNIYITINKTIIYAQTHEELSPITHPTDNLNEFMQIISGRANYYITNVLGETTFDKLTIEYNAIIRDFFKDNLYNDENMNAYFYIPIDSGIVSMRAYYDKEQKAYLLHFDVLDTDATLDTSAQLQLLTTTSKNFKTISDITDPHYAKIKSDYMTYIEMLDRTYGTNFGSVAESRIDAVIKTLTDAVTNGNTNITFNIDNVKVTETNKNQVLGYGYVPVAATDYSSLSFRMIPTDDVKQSTTSLE